MIFFIYRKINNSSLLYLYVNMISNKMSLLFIEILLLFFFIYIKLVKFKIVLRKQQPTQGRPNMEGGIQAKTSRFEIIFFFQLHVLHMFWLNFILDLIVRVLVQINILRPINWLIFSSFLFYQTVILAYIGSSRSWIPSIFRAILWTF